jgi:hypothetical protein
MKDIPTSPRIIEIKRQRRIRWTRFFLLYIFLFILFIGVLSFFSGHKKVVIHNIEISGNRIIDEEEITEDIHKDILGKYLYLFSKNNILIYPKNKIYNNLITKYTRIENLSINLINFNTLKINITERTGTLLYCGNDIPGNKENIGENCYFINDDGFVFDQAPYFSGNVYFKYYMKLSDENDNPLGSQLLDKESFHQLNRFIDDIILLGFKPIYLKKENDNIIYLYLNHKMINVAPYIVFRLDDELDALVEDFSLAMNKKEFAEEINTKYDKLLYIDLRFKNKILYKFQ